MSQDAQKAIRQSKQVRSKGFFSPNATDFGRARTLNCA